MSNWLPHSNIHSPTSSTRVSCRASERVTVTRQTCAGYHNWLLPLLIRWPGPTDLCLYRNKPVIPSIPREAHVPPLVVGGSSSWMCWSFRAQASKIESFVAMVEICLELPVQWSHSVFMACLHCSSVWLGHCSCAPDWLNSSVPTPDVANNRVSPN